MENYNQFAPGLQKLIRNPEHLSKLLKREPTAPLHLSLWPNSLCQLKCSYCCGKHMGYDEGELTLEQFKDLIDVLYKYGTRALEFSGTVGEPLLWTHFKDAVDYGHFKGMKMSLITNGLGLSITPEETLRKLNWARISLQSPSHAKRMNFKGLKNLVRISASFIVPDEKRLSVIPFLYQYSKDNDDLTIRIATIRPCTEEWESTVREEVKKFGNPLFFSEKERGVPKTCSMAWVRGAVDWKGQFLPCPSIQLNYEWEGSIPSDFALCHISNLEEWILNNPIRDLGYRCSFCSCGKQENDFLADYLVSQEDVEFV